MRHIQTWLLVALAGLATEALSQDAAPVIGGFEPHGSITAGYRFTDVGGRREKFDELFGLRSGFRVHGLTLTAQSVEDASFADTISLTSTGLGGEPYSTTRLRIARNGVWEAGGSYRQAYNYWDRNDAAVQPSGRSGLTSNHDFATARRLGSADFSLYATPDLKLTFGYDRSRRDGRRVTTRTIDYFDPPSSWGAFARANPYLVDGPVEEVSNEFSAGFTWSPETWSFFYRAGYRRYDETLDVGNVTSPQRSINVDDPVTSDELVETAEWSEARRIGAPFSEFSYSGRLRAGLKVRGGYIYYRNSGTTRYDAAFAGVARANSSGSVLEPYDVVTSVDGDLGEPIHVVDQGFTLDVTRRIAFHADYRYSRFTVENDVRFASVDADGPASGSEELRWEQGLHTLDAAFEIVPRDNLLIRPGIRLVKRDVTFTENGTADAQASRPSRVASPTLSVYYAPIRELTFRGDVRNTTNGGPYTRVTPRTDFGGRWVVRYAPTERFRVENTFRFRNADYTTTDFESRVRLNATSVLFDASESLALSGGFTYDSYLATSSLRFLRGTPPLDVAWRDQTISRVWQAGVAVTPRPWVRLRVNGNYVRTTGAGEISGELPTFGPLRWPMVSGTVDLEIPRAGTLSLDLQRTYYIEEIVQGDNFSANLLGLRWAREF